MSLELNAFDQYDQLENRLTKALGVTLDHSKDFCRVFLKELAGKVALSSDACVTLQMCGGAREEVDEACGIPDIAIIDDEDRGVIVEAKLGAALGWKQLVSHENRMKRNGIEIISALAITGRDKDRDALEKWKQEGRFGHGWKHVAWRDVYRLACSHVNLSPWVRELRDYMQIMAACIDEDEMGADVQIIEFTGITPEMLENYTPALAKRLIRSFMDDLRSDKLFLKEIGIPIDQVPRNRKAIKSNMRVWDLLSPVKDEENFTDSHHFTVGITPERIEGALTIPNACARKLVNFAKNNSIDEFSNLISEFLKGLNSKGVIKAGGRPIINIVQRRFQVMSEYATDGHVEFDPRVWTGVKLSTGEPDIKQQPEWLLFSKTLMGGRSSNIQFQIGVRFFFGKCAATQTSDVLKLIKDVFRATMPVVQKLGYQQ